MNGSLNFCCAGVASGAVVLVEGSYPIVSILAIVYHTLRAVEWCSSCCLWWASISAILASSAASLLAICGGAWRSAAERAAGWSATQQHEAWGGAGCGGVRSPRWRRLKGEVRVLSFAGCAVALCR